MYDANRPLIIAIVFLLIILLCGTSGLVSYSYGKNIGYQEGHKSGQDYNYSQVLDKGKDEGYKIGYEAGYKSKLGETRNAYSLRNPTYQEMKDFLKKDTANSKPYLAGQRTCVDFAGEVNNNAESQGIRCAVVYIVYPETGHSIVAFETTDKGLIFVEPQFDREVTLPIGKSYSKVNNFLQQEPIDDTIQRYQVMW
jgi:hypothetical protein